jgi:O-Antigen ligase
MMFLQWKHWISAPNEFFLTTGMFFSPNQLGIYLSIGFLSTIFLLKKATVLWLKISLALSGILIFVGLCITESRGAFISLFVAMIYNLLQSKLNFKSLNNWKIYTGIALLLIGSFYFFSIVNINKTESTSGRWFTTTQVLKQIEEQPLGYGLNSFAFEYNKAKATYFEKNINWEEMKNAGYIYKANNDFLEFTFELGVPWMILCIVFIVLLFWKKGNSIGTKIGRTVLLCLVIFSLTTSIVTTPIFLIIACISLIVIINTTNPKVVYEFKNHSLFRFLVMGLIVSFAFVIISRINAENKLFRLYEDKMYLKSDKQLQGYISKIDNKGEEFFMGGLILIKNGFINEGFHYLQIGFERSGKPSLGRVLANGLKQQKKYSQAGEIFTYNKNVEPYRYEARMDLLNLYIETNQDAKAKEMANEIIKLRVNPSCN